MKRCEQKQIIVRIDEDTRTKLRIKVLQENTSIQEVLENAIHEYLNSDKDKYSRSSRKCYTWISK